MEKVRLEAYLECSTFCCGLYEVGNLEAGNEEYHSEDDIKDENKRHALFATTITGQKNEVKRLKALGFRKITSWKNKSTKNQVTLWFKKPKGQRW